MLGRRHAKTFGDTGNTESIAVLTMIILVIKSLLPFFKQSSFCVCLFRLLTKETELGVDAFVCQSAKLAVNIENCLI